ncbi:MAG: hypothetical protein U1A72_12445, partial [Sulfuritalea sp.]|nr:hypothetical protein [Sulfuritalea sp.]
GVVTTLADVQGQIKEKGWLSATASLFNQSATIYLYWPDKKDLNKAPIVIVPLLELNAKAVFDSILKVPSELDVGLKSPILFWLPERFGVADLERAKMPDKVPDRAGRDTGLPETVRMNPGLNLFGRVASGFLGDLLKTVNLDANNLTAGLATGKDAKGAAVYVVGLTMASEWKKPFGLDQTSITGATVRVIKEKVSQSKTIETWGTVRIKAKDYTAYLQRSGLSETLAFDTKDASLKQFFDIADVVSSTLGLPKVPFPSELPVDKVTLRNDRYVSKLDPASPPKFDNMMFMGSKGVSSDDPKLYINSSAYVYGWQAGKGYVKASKLGVDGDFAMNLPKIGPIGASSGKFYLKVVTSGLGKFSTSPAMGIKLTAPLFGDMDLKASSSGLKLVAAPSCPLRPFGFTADVTDLTKADFPITPMLGDCFGKALDDLVDGAEDAYKEAEPFVVDAAGESADTAKDLYKDAAAIVDENAIKRAAAWTTTIGEFQATKDAARAADDAYKAAKDTIVALGNTVESAGKEIVKLTSKIEGLLEKVWGAISGELKTAKKDRSNAISRRDDARTQQPAAEARVKQAKDILEKKTQEAAQLASPYVAKSLADSGEPLLGALTQTRVQDGIVKSMGNLRDDLAKNASSRKAFFEKAGTADNPLDKRLDNARRASEDQFKTYRNLSDLVKAGGDHASSEMLSGAKKKLISEAISAKLSAETEQLLEKEVSALPTMNNAKWVSIVSRDDVQRCLTLGPFAPQASKHDWSWTTCSGGIDQQFMFQASGVVLARTEFSNEVGRQCLYLWVDGPWYALPPADKTCVAQSLADKGSAALLFFDPIDGLIRLSPNPTMGLQYACVYTGASTRGREYALGLGQCPRWAEQAPGARFDLIDPGEGLKPKTVPAIRTVAAGGPTHPTASYSSTNLAPLKLKPLKLK